MTVKKKLYFVLDTCSKSGYHIFSSSQLAYDYCRKLTAKIFNRSSDYPAMLKELIDSYCKNREDFGINGMCRVTVLKLDSEE